MLRGTPGGAPQYRYSTQTFDLFSESHGSRRQIRPRDREGGERERERESLGRGPGVSDGELDCDHGAYELSG